MIDNEKTWEKIQEFVKLYLVDGIPAPEEVLLLDAFPGSGKTRNTLSMLINLDRPFIYIAPNHGVITDNLTFHEDDYIGGFIHFMAREKLCFFEDKKEMAARYHMPIKPFCSNCTMRSRGCEYYDRKWEIEKQNPPSWAGVHSHFPTYLNNYIHGNEDNRGHVDDFDVLVIEENPIGSLMINKRLNRKDLTILEEELGNFPCDDEEQVDLFSSIIDYFFTRIGRSMNYRSLYREVVAWREFDMERWKKFHEKWDLYIVTRIMDNENPMRNVPKDIINLMSDICQNATRETIPYHILPEKDDNTGEEFISLNYFYGDCLRNIPIQIIALDGTANVTLWRRMLGRRIHAEKITYKFKNIYQINTHKYPQRSWLYKGYLTDTGKSLLEITENIVKKRNTNTLLIGSKKLKKHVERHFQLAGLDKKIEYAWYYNLRSKNYLHCDTIVLLMRPSPSPVQIDIYTALSGWDREIWEHHFTRDEMLQALARIRSNLREVSDNIFGTRTRDKTELFIFSNENLFEEGDVDTGSYFQINKPTMKHFVATNTITPLPTTRGDLVVRKKILDVLSDGNEYMFKELLDRIGSAKILKRMLDRMVIIKEIYYWGNKYGIAR